MNPRKSVEQKFGSECCTRRCKKQKIACEENGLNFELKIEDDVVLYLVKIDSCYYKKGSKDVRCDYMVVSKCRKFEIYIELKSEDFEKAVKQILKTHKELHEQSECKSKYACIVLKDSKCYKVCQKSTSKHKGPIREMKKKGLKFYCVTGSMSTIFKDKKLEKVD